MAESRFEPDAPSRAHIWVTGRVQGVGFRAYVEYNARQIGITGWVRNVGYETVEALVEGSHEQVETLILLMKTGPRASRVDECRVEYETSAGEFRDFQVKSSR